MAKKPATHSPVPKTTAATAPAKPVSGPVSTPAPPAAKPAPQSTLSPRSSPQEIIIHVWNRYVQDTPSRTILLDVFMAWLVVVGVLQFLYCVLAGNYPFNAFLSGFSAAVGQFVLTASLRMQTSELPPSGASTAKKTSSKSIDTVSGELVENGKVSTERAFADFIFGSLILHGFCVNFIN
ncbi:oligosaccharyl transferase complex subunit OST4 [Exophiala aquamarina CBS 119918]|uniref:Dolichyl-diphosphooligosaccharide--protein glycosyltransferase subunit OST2 n=1 Tax=Exophiala aquamarina CBS 119918 TaxID=1182545 RepID=A0A072PEL3_9EURO|nr:oligosaccharyl transferase complex subunit OST4 [Exophiala aquamarina CBS 119918]KEF54010.1 oligosaccharyl transferase complex subunit OST4 [Exophiala aquamarina CBS 119918]